MRRDQQALMNPLSFYCMGMRAGKQTVTWEEFSVDNWGRVYIRNDV